MHFFLVINVLSQLAIDLTSAWLTKVWQESRVAGRLLEAVEWVLSTPLHKLRKIANSSQNSIIYNTANPGKLTCLTTCPTLTMRPFHVQRYLLTGLLTIMPIWLTWVVFKFIFSLLSEASAPWVSALFDTLGDAYPGMVDVFRQPWAISLLAFVITLVALYTLGFTANRVLGARLVEAFDRLMERIPMVRTIYGGTKKLMAMMQNKPGGTQRVVLINFPSPELKSIGFVTRVFRDAKNREYAAVYVPTTPNPTGGYLEIVAVEKLTATDWSVDQAMAFILSGGAVAPDSLPFGEP